MNLHNAARSRHLIRGDYQNPTRQLWSALVEGGFEWIWHCRTVSTIWLSFPTEFPSWANLVAAIGCRTWQQGVARGTVEGKTRVQCRQQSSKSLLVAINPPACRRVWLEGVVLVSVLGLYLFLFLACTCSFVLLLRVSCVWIKVTPPH